MRIINKKLCESYRGKPCLVCEKPSVGHHIKTKGSGGDDAPYNLMPLCFIHHRRVHDLGLTLFAKVFPMIAIYLIGHGWEYDHFLDKWTRSAQK